MDETNKHTVELMQELIGEIRKGNIDVKAYAEQEFVDENEQERYTFSFTYAFDDNSTQQER